MIEDDKEVIQTQDEHDNVIRSRYITTGAFSSLKRKLLRGNASDSNVAVGDALAR